MSPGLKLFTQITIGFSRHLAPVAMAMIVASFCILLVMAYRTAKARAIVKKSRAAQMLATAKE